MPTVRVHHADGLWLADAARPGALRPSGPACAGLKGGAPADFKVLRRTSAHGADVARRGAGARLHGLAVRSHCTGTVSVHARSPPRRGWSQFDRARRGGCCAALASLHRDGDAGSTGWPVTLLFLLGSFI